MFDKHIKKPYLEYGIFYVEFLLPVFVFSL